MTVAYAVSAYRLPDQLVRLVRRLHTESSHIVVHVDAKSDRRVYDAMVDGVRGLPRVGFVERHPSYWGGFGHVRATLKCLERLYEHDVPFDHLVLLTGQDYPLRPALEIEQFLAGSDGSSFMSHWTVPKEGWAGRGGLDRIERWHLVRGRRLHVAVPLPGRRIPGGLRPFGGGPYWCLARAAVDRVRELLAERPELVSFFEHVWIPDELFFQTLLLNSPVAGSIVNDNLRYTDWSRSPAPAVLGTGDLEPMLASGKLFARKFDVTVDAEVLGLLDRRAEEGIDAR